MEFIPPGYAPKSWVLSEPTGLWEKGPAPTAEQDQQIHNFQWVSEAYSVGILACLGYPPFRCHRLCAWNSLLYDGFWDFFPWCL